jgi:hypothetical protein
MALYYSHDVATPLWRECEVATHTPENGSLESFGTPEKSEDDCRGQNTLHWGVLYTIGKVLKCTCPKWPRMNHLNICSPSYGQKKGQESNWQFDSRTLKVGNRPLLNVFRRSATWRWKVLKESYNFRSDLTPIGGWSREIWAPKVLGVQPGTVSGLLFESHGKKSHLDVASVERHRVYTIWWKVVASPESRPWWVKWVQGCPWFVPTPNRCRMSSNHFVVGFGCKTQ